jgi:hypothetical protein
MASEYDEVMCGYECNKNQDESALKRPDTLGGIRLIDQEVNNFCKQIT